ncbi:MAG: PKD domain-containing protein [Salinivirgaceae bacterium]
MKQLKSISRILFAAISVFLLMGGFCERDEDVQPVACFTYEPVNDILPGDLVSFTNCSTDADSYKWDFDDGEESVATNPEHEFDEPRVYDVKLVVTTKNLQDEIIHKITVKSNIVACFTMSTTTAEVGETVNFTNCSTGADSYSWDFGDGQTSTNTSPTHSFSSAGNFDVILIAKKGTDSKQITHSITINAPSVTACFNMSTTSAYVGETVTLTNCSVGATSYEWDTDGDGITNFTDKDLYVYYGTAGTYNIKLTARNGSESDTDVQTIVITDAVIDPKVYLMPVVWTEYYRDDFNATGSWYVGSDSEFSANVSGGYYTLTTYRADNGFYISYPSCTMPPTSANYDIEILYKVIYNNGAYTGGNGMYWGFNESSSDLYYYAFDLNSGQGIYNFGNHNGSFNNGWQFGGISNDFNLLTCRKYDNTYYFFLNKEFIKSTTYLGDYGDVLAISTDELSQIMVEKVQIYTATTSKSGQIGTNSTAPIVKADITLQPGKWEKPVKAIKKYAPTGKISKPVKITEPLISPVLKR